MKSIILFTAALASLAGCASTDSSSTSQTAPSELIYRTGSNIPIRTTTPVTKEEKERQAEESKRSLEAIQRGGPGATKPQ